VRFQDAARDGRAVVYANVQADPVVVRVADRLATATTGQRVLARAVMNGGSTDPDRWRAMFPTLFGSSVADGDRAAAESLLADALAVADRGDQVRSQLRGAIVEALTERILGRRVDASTVRRERRILFDGVRAEIHPYDVTVERAGGSEAWDCKWGARGIGADVLHQLDDARTNAEAEDEVLRVGLVVFDAERSCEVGLGRQTAPWASTALVALESLDGLADEA
jgi:hypothetical protein